MSTRSEFHQRPLMAVANDAIDRLHRSFDLPDSDFFCECGHSGCKERITLSRAEYAGLRDEGGLLIAPAHADREPQGARASRMSIEQAKGVLIERHGMTPDAAFEALRQRARNQRRSLDEVCAQIVAWAGTPDSERSEPAPSAAPRPSRESYGRRA